MGTWVRFLVMVSSWTIVRQKKWVSQGPVSKDMERICCWTHWEPPSLSQGATWGAVGWPHALYADIFQRTRGFFLGQSELEIIRGAYSQRGSPGWRELVLKTVWPWTKCFSLSPVLERQDLKITRSGQVFSPGCFDCEPNTLFTELSHYPIVLQSLAYLIIP